MRKKLRLALVIGHTKKAPGAYSKHLGESEYVYNTDLAKQCQVYAHLQGISVTIHTRDKGGVKGAFSEALKTKPHAIIELHFNAFNGQASGSETLFSDNYDKAGVKELALAYLLSKSMAKTLGIPNRGVKERGAKGERGFANLMQTTSTASVLIESGFGDNHIDAYRMKTRKTQLAKSIVDSFVEWASEVM